MNNIERAVQPTWVTLLIWLTALFASAVLISAVGNKATNAAAACIRQYQAAATRADTLTVALTNDNCKALLRAVERGNK